LPTPRVLFVIEVTVGDALATYQRPDFLCDMIIFRRRVIWSSLCRRVFTALLVFWASSL